MIIYAEYGHKKIREERMWDLRYTIYDLEFGIWDLRKADC